jgi:alpha-2-macroglobulin
VDPAALKQGARIIVRLTVSADAAREMQTVVDDPLPAGLEIEAVLRPADAQGVVQRPEGEGDEGEGGEGGGVTQRKAATPGRFAFLGTLGEPSLQEKRDDRYVAAFTLGGSRSYPLAYVARAVTAGAFFLPGAEAKNMYRPTVGARTAPARLKVAAAP